MKNSSTFLEHSRTRDGHLREFLEVYMTNVLSDRGVPGLRLVRSQLAMPLEAPCSMLEVM